MPRKKSQGTPSNKSIKTAEPQPQEKIPIKTCIIDKNDKRLEENRVDSRNKMVRGSDTNKYLHKKFKKVATLEETSPAKAKGVLYPIPEDQGLPRINGRYVCPYCQISCAKPSVLEKHIRAHTNERPYPCLPCGFAFKTKSNLYKHCRSRSHTLKVDSQSSEEEEGLQEVKKIYKPKFHLSEANPVDFLPVVSPSPEVLQMRINKLISDNQAIVNDPIWPKKKSPSPLRNGDSRSPFSLKSATPEPEEIQPLNLTVKEPRKRSLSETMISKGGSIIKDILLKTREKPDLSKVTDAILHPCPNCKVVFRTLENLNTHLYSCKPKSSPGPLLGKTPLIDSFRDLKKRKIDFSLKFEENKKSVKLFGGEVQILDSPNGEAKTMRIDGRKEYSESSMKKEVLTISKTGLHSVGGTMIQSESVSPKPIYPEKMVLPILPHPVAPPNIPGIASPLRYPPNINPLTTITGFNALTLPTSTLSPLKSKSPNPKPYNGVVTIFHAGKQIPYVQGIPGPNSLLATQPLIREKQEKTVIIKPTPQKIESNPMLPLRIETDGKHSPSRDHKETNAESGEKKFLRPTSLPLKPGTYTPKKSLTTPNVMPLISPETPRPKKSYGQFFLNGHAYTYLGMKISTKPFFCTKQPQPIYLPLSPDQYPAVSMYSYWEIIKDKSPTPPGLDTRKAMSYYDSRNKDGAYTTSNRNRQDLMTHSSYFTSQELTKSETDTLPDSKKEDENEPNPKRVKVCEGGFESNEDYTYVRGRGRGRYVCEECGIRCKKPSMLKKHIRTHTDLRPYTCKYCAFSFKTKGNLTKHMKSKTHFKKCKELDVSPGDDQLDYPDSLVDDSDHVAGDDESEEETDEDDDDDEDDDSADEGEDCKIEREAAKSLLSLSVVALESEHRQNVSAGLVAQTSRPRSFPYVSTIKEETEESPKVQPWLKELLTLTKDCPDFKVDEMRSRSSSSESSPSSVSPLSSRPMDLSNKPLLGCAKTSVITSVSGPLPLIPPPLSSNIENIPPSLPTPTTEYPENSLLLHAYLTERAVRDLKIKQHQMSDIKSLAETESSAKEEKVSEGNASPVVVLPSGPAVTRTEPDKIRIPTPPVESPIKSPPAEIIASPNKQLKAEFFPPSSTPNLSYISTTEDGRSMCVMCNKVFNKPSQLRLHVNIHYFERPFRCDSCAVSFRTKGHLQKHQRSLAHLNKVNMNSTFGTATTSNPRPFKCTDCKVAFRIHGHLAKHFRSKMHIMKLECTGKLPFGTYADLEKFGVNMNDIDTTDCENSLESLQLLAAKMADMATKVSSKMSWEDSSDCSTKCGSDDEVGSGGGTREKRSPPKDSSSAPPLPPALCFQKEVNF